MGRSINYLDEAFSIGQSPILVITLIDPLANGTICWSRNQPVAQWFLLANGSEHIH